MTLVLRKVDDRWRIVHRHADPLVREIPFERFAELDRGSGSGAELVMVGVVVDEQHVLGDVQEAPAVGLTQVLAVERLAWGAGGDDPTGEQHHAVTAGCVAQVVGGHDHATSSGPLVGEHPVRIH